MAVYQKKNKTQEVVKKIPPPIRWIYLYLFPKVHNWWWKKFPPPYVGLASDVLPEAQSYDKAESSRTGVSTNYALSGTNISKPVLPVIYKKRREEDIPHWYALRTTYGREKKAYDYMIGKGVTAFYPTQTKVKLINGKRKEVTESLLPNIFFAYGT